MHLKFTKMHGAGNDFVVVDAYTRAFDWSADQWSAFARHVGDRHLGVGCDQILIVERPRTEGVDFRYRIFNADGGEVEQCGNGSRCFVRFVHDHGLSQQPAIRVETLGGVITPRLEPDGRVTVDMGAPVLDIARVPFAPPPGAPRREAGCQTLFRLEGGGTTVDTDPWIAAVSMGNPHAVQVVEDVDTAPVTLQGARIEGHPWFPRRVNAGFMQIVNPHEIRLRVFERGVGETLACGTGACAAVVAGIRQGLLESPVLVHARGGDLSIAWDGAGAAVRMTGPAVTVFEGEIAFDPPV